MRHTCGASWLLGAIDFIHKDNVQLGERYLPISATYSYPFRETVERYHI